MRIVLTTDTPQFFADIADVLRVFFGEAQVLPEGERDATLTHTHAERDGMWHECCSLALGEQTYAHEAAYPVVTGRLEAKRYLKRAVKLCCYDLLKQATGIKPPWGSLTGIRPTRLFYEQLAQGKSEAEACRALVDTFDLAEDKAALLAEIARSQQGLMDAAERDVDIYVGIPFCTTRCTYCSFASGEIGDGRLVAPYLAALSREIAATRVLIAEAGLSPRALYIGGGTPTALTTPQLDGLMTELASAFPNVGEWTVEAGRPDTLDREKLRMLRRYPVTRISINPQTLQDGTLARIGRAHTAAQTAEAYQMAREAGFDHINMDLICALPGETERDFADTLEKAALLHPESLTIHTLAIKRASKLRGMDYAPCTAEAAQRMVDRGREAAHAMGLAAYYLYRQKYMAGNLENVGYALPGCACQYNIDIMEETTSILALGAGAISKRVFRGEGRIERAPNVSNLDHYLARIDEMIARKRRIFLAP